MITIALSVDKRDEDGQGVPEDKEVGAKAAILHKHGKISIFGKRADRQRIKQERVLRRTRKAKRQLRLASAITGDREVEGPAAGGGAMGNRNENQTEASYIEGASTNIMNIGNETGGLISATDLQGKTKMGQPAKDGTAQRAGEEDEEEKKRELRRIERKEERAVHALLQECKSERDLEKQIQEEDDRILSEDNDEIWRDLNKSSEGEDTGVEVNKCESESMQEKEKEGAGSIETSLNRVGLAKKVHGPGRGHPPRVVKGWEQ